MSNPIEIAEKLGEALAESAELAAVREAEKAVMANAEAQELMNEFHTATMKIRQKEMTGQPVEPEDKHAAQELGEKVAANELLAALSEAQNAWSGMMNGVNSTIAKKIGFGDSCDDESCAGCGSTCAE